MIYTPRIPRGSKYSLYTADGNGYNPPWNGSIVDMLTALVADVDQPTEERERAARALKFYAERVAAEGDQPTAINLHVAKAFGQTGAQMLWETPEDCSFTTKVWDDGVTRTNILSKKYHQHASVAEPEPTPGPMPQFEPAVPLPALPPTDTEVLARMESFQYLEGRYSDASVAVRLKAVEDAAADLRAMRDQPTPVIVLATIPPSAEEKKAIVGITIASPSDEKIASLQAGVQPLTTVEQIEATVAADRDVQARYEAALNEVARLKALLGQS